MMPVYSIFETITPWSTLLLSLLPTTNRRKFLPLRAPIQSGAKPSQSLVLVTWQLGAVVQTQTELVTHAASAASSELALSARKYSAARGDSTASARSSHCMASGAMARAES